MVVGNLVESTEIAVLGAGPGGYVAAIRLAQYGKEVTLISSDPLPGGECLHRGCIPSKALIEAASFYRKAQNAADFGIHFEGMRLDLIALQKWKQNILSKLSQGILQLLSQNKIRYLVGTGRLADAHRLEIETGEGLQTLEFQNLILATGSRPRSLKGWEFDGKNILSSTDVLSLDSIPKTFLVIGGGYIGLELGTVLAKWGSQVTVVEMQSELLPGTAPELVRPVKKRLKELGVKIHTESAVSSPQTTSLGVEVEIQTAKGEKEKQVFEKVLVAIGRTPNSEDLRLERAQLHPDAKRFLEVDSQCRTAQPHILAIGDLAGGVLLAHKASREGLVAAATIAGKADAFDNLIPAVIFTDPEIAYVGLTEAEADRRGISTCTGLFGFGANARALTLNEAEGFIRVVAEKFTQRVLGVQMVGPHVSDLISEATLGIEMGASLEDFALTIHPHPTLSEALLESMESALGLSIHRYQRKIS